MCTTVSHGQGWLDMDLRSARPEFPPSFRYTENQSYPRKRLLSSQRAARSSMAIDLRPACETSIGTSRCHSRSVVQHVTEGSSVKPHTSLGKSFGPPHGTLQLASTAAQRRRSTSVRGFTAFEPEVVDKDFVDELNKVSNKTLEVLSSGSETKAQELSEELEDMLQILESVEDQNSSRFIRVLKGLLNHTVLKEAAQLEGLYSSAADRIFNQLAGSDWKLVEEGRTAQADEPKFSTWEDIFESKGQPRNQPQPSVKDISLYRLLNVEVEAQPADIKIAYRRLALQLHPDVNPAPDATERFAELSNAYDILSDETSRALYDEYGMDLGSKPGAEAGRGNARDAWEEFKPFKRENKHTKARSAVTRQAGEMSNGGAEGEAALPQVGDVVEYPLRDIETEDFADGRTHGVGLLVGRNIDRGDAKKLPEDSLSLCEVEPLRQEEPDSNRWIADELGVSSFAKLEEMQVVPVVEFNSRFDIWTIDAPLSAGCGGPPLPEEVNREVSIWTGKVCKHVEAD